MAKNIEVNALSDTDINTIKATTQHCIEAFLQYGRTEINGQKALGKIGATIAADVLAAYTLLNPHDAEFIRVFGNGEPTKSKTRISGELFDGVVLGLANCKDERCVIKTKAIASQRIMEARKLRGMDGYPAAGESVQAAFKRYAAKAKTQSGSSGTTPNPGGNETQAFTFPKDATMQQVAEAVSLWVANHGNAATALAGLLKDSLPISVQRTRRQA
jgi:hypothetical protein